MSGAVELYLLRHAHAGDPGSWDGPDAERPLSEKGRGHCERLGAFLAATGFQPDAIIASPKTRAEQTAELVADALGLTVEIDERLGHGIDVEGVEDVLRAAGDPFRAVLVGHDPDFTELVAALASAENAPMRKGALARIDAERPLRPGSGELRWLLPPDLLAAWRVGAS